MRKLPGLLATKDARYLRRLVGSAVSPRRDRMCMRSPSGRDIVPGSSLFAFARNPALLSPIGTEWPARPL